MGSRALEPERPLVQWFFLWVWGVVAAFAFGLFLVETTETFGSTWADVLRHAGMFLEALGLGLVAVKVTHLRDRFSGPASAMSQIASTLRTWWRRFRRVRPVPVRLEVQSSEHLHVSEHVELRVRRSTLEGRVTELERQLEELRTLSKKVERDLRAEASARGDAIAKFARQREEVESRLREEIRALAVGSLALESVGLWWILLGLFFTTWHAEVATLLGLSVS